MFALEKIEHMKKLFETENEKLQLEITKQSIYLLLFPYFILFYIL